MVGRECLEALNTTVKRDFHDPETLRAALETLLVVFMYEDHPVLPSTPRVTSSHQRRGLHYKNYKMPI